MFCDAECFSLFVFNDYKHCFSDELLGCMLNMGINIGVTMGISIGVNMGFRMFIHI